MDKWNLINRLLGEVYTKFEEFISLPKYVITEDQPPKKLELPDNTYDLGFVHGLLLAIKIIGGEDGKD